MTNIQELLSLTEELHQKYTKYLDEEFATIPNELRFKLGIVESKLYKIARLIKQYQLQAD